jgi:hypothetical protein
MRGRGPRDVGSRFVVGPGLIVGPHDPTGSFAWVAGRVLGEAGRRLFLGRRSAPSTIDARSRGMELDMAEQRVDGTLTLSGSCGHVDVRYAVDVLGCGASGRQQVV